MQHCRASQSLLSRRFAAHKSLRTHICRSNFASIYSPSRQFHNAPFCSQQRLQDEPDPSSSSKDRNRASFWTRLRKSLNSTQIEWYPIPASLGIAVVAFVYLSKKRRHEGQRGPSSYGDTDIEVSKKPWQVYVLSTLPLRSFSRLWGRFNEIELPVWLRVPGYKLYAYIFGCDLSEVKEEKLVTYKNLAEFFIRELKPGCRPLDNNYPLVSRWFTQIY